MEPRNGGLVVETRHLTLLPKVAETSGCSSGRVYCSIFAKLFNKILLARQKEKQLLSSGAAVVSNKASGTGSMLLLLVGGIVVTSNYSGEFHGVKDNSMDKEHFILLSIFSPGAKIVTCCTGFRSPMQSIFFMAELFTSKTGNP